MLPVVAGRLETRRQIVIYSALLVPLAVLPALIGFAGAFYGATAIISGAVFMALALGIWSAEDDREVDHKARHLFRFSIFYLFMLFAALLIERVAAAVMS
jgi:protoheme IX farnesyltransferase